MFINELLAKSLESNGAGWGTRTPDLMITSQLLAIHTYFHITHIAVNLRIVKNLPAHIIVHNSHNCIFNSYRALTPKKHIGRTSKAFGVTGRPSHTKNIGFPKLFRDLTKLVSYLISEGG